MCGLPDPLQVQVEMLRRFCWGGKRLILPVWEDIKSGEFFSVSESKGRPGYNFSQRGGASQSQSRRPCAGGCAQAKGDSTARLG